MPAPTTPPTKIGAKIDLVAKLIGERLKPHGFVRKGRLIHREIGEGIEACQQTIELQGSKWNAGTTGQFTVNLGILFPAIVNAAASPVPGINAASATPDVRPAFGQARIFERLGGVVPDAVAPGWPAALKRGVDYWASVDLDTDLTQLGEAIATVLVEHALPWFAARASLRQACLVDRGLRPSDAIVGLLLIREYDAAREALSSGPPHRFAQGADDWQRFIDLLRLLGLSGDTPPWQPPPAHPMQERRRTEVTHRIAGHKAAVEDYLAQAGDDGWNDTDALLDAWIHAMAIEQSGRGPKGGRLWDRIARASLASRRLLTVRALERCKDDGPTVQSTLVNVWAEYPDFHLGAFSTLVVQLLDIDDVDADPAFVQALLRALAMSADKVTEDLMADNLRVPLPAIVRWIARHASPACRYQVRPTFTTLVDDLCRLAIERDGERARSPPPADLLGPELAARVAELFTPEARERTVAAFREFPERAYGAEDREAIIQLRRWARARPDGHVPLVIEGDDWGRSLSDALGTAPQSLREALLRLLQWFDEGVETRPSKRWVLDLQRRLAEIDHEALVEWLASTLPRFADTRLEHVAATPGIGAFPGITSGRAALGLVHAAASLDSPKLLEPLYTLAEAALVVVPGFRMRAQGIATAAFEPLARRPAGRAKLESLLRKVKQKPVIASIKKAILTGAG